MFMKKAILVTFLLTAPLFLFAQQKKTPAPPPAIKNCHLPADSAADNTLPLEEIKYWADTKPLNVRCGKSVYTLHQFSISIIKQNPMQTLDFGTGNAGIPLLARKTIDQMGPLDTVLLRDVTGKDDTGKEVKLSTIVFKVEPAAVTPDTKSDAPADTTTNIQLESPKN